MSLVAVLLPSLAARAFAEPSTGVGVYGLVDYAAFVTGVPGLGVGVELARARDSIALDASGGVLPLCFVGCTTYAWGGFSLAYHHQLTEHIFIGPRVAAVYRGVGVSEPSDDDLFGWATLGLVEVGFRRAEHGWIAGASLGAGVSVAADHTLGPAVSVRATVGR